LGTCVGIISQPENRSVEEPDQPDCTLSKRKSLIDGYNMLAISPNHTLIQQRRSRVDSAKRLGMK
ncbi:MAG: hypothetical protein ACKO1G_14365, partial [Microcystis aeruginosa]